jgi:outer membrane protein assembly factor BamB
MVETPVRTESDVPGEQVWPTQPYPYSSKGVPMTPFCATLPIVQDPEKATRARPLFWPPSLTEFLIMSNGGSSYGSPAFSPRTNLLYVTGKNAASSFTVKIAGDTLRPSPTPVGNFDTVARRDQDSGVPRTHTVSAYNPITGELVWQHEYPMSTNAGNLVTAGDLLFQGSDAGEFFALDARNGKELFTTTVRRSIRASPLTYRAKGKQYVAFVASHMIHAYGLK